MAGTSKSKVNAVRGNKRRDQITAAVDQMTRTPKSKSKKAPKKSTDKKGLRKTSY